MHLPQTGTENNAPVLKVNFTQKSLINFNSYNLCSGFEFILPQDKIKNLILSPVDQDKEKSDTKAKSFH